MMKVCSRTLTIVSALLLAACSESTDTVGTTTEPTPTSSQSAPIPVVERSATQSASPESVAHAFMEAGNSADTEALQLLFTEKAREGITRDDLEMNPAEMQVTDFEVGAATIEENEADVPIEIKDVGEEGVMHLLMRQVDEDWRIYAMRAEMQGMEFTFNFEDVEQSMKNMFGGLFDEEALAGVAESMQKSMETSFEDMFAGGSEEEIAKEKAVFDALRPLTTEEFDAQWKIDFSARDRTAEDVLRELTAKLGLALDARGVETALAHAVTVDLKGISRLQVIEDVCRQVNLYPIYPDGGDMSGGLLGEMLATLAEGLVELVGEDMPDDAGAEAAEIPANAVSFMEGERPWPVAFAGPFIFAVNDVIENVPHATGSISIAARAFAIEPSAVQLTADGFTLNFEPVSDANGNSLSSRGGSGMNQSSGSVYAVTKNIPLRNLLRDVTEIGVIRDTQQMIYPSAMEETVLDKLVEGATYQAGEFSIELTAVGTSIAFKIQGKDETAEDASHETDRDSQERVRQRMDNLIVKYSPRDSEGNAMGVTMDMSRPLFDSYKVHFSTNEPPASVHLKIVSKVTEVEYPIELKNIPLNHHAEMPEKLETLLFAGHDAPVTVEFIEIRKDPNFPPEHAPENILVRVTNHSNKNAHSIRCQLVYLDEQGSEVERFSAPPTTLTGKVTQDGIQPVVARNATEEVETTAFFMPGQTKNVRVDLQGVEFIDGTTWRSE